MGPLIIKTYGVLAEKFEGGEFPFPYQKDTEALLEQLKDQYPFLKTSSFSLSVDKTIVQGNTALNGNEELALLPPFSGG